MLCEVESYRAMRDSAATSSDEEGSGAEALNTAFSLVDWIDEALIVCDADMVVTFANRVARALIQLPASAIFGRPLFEALPRLNGSLMEVHARRTLIGREPSSADIPSPFKPGAWLRFQSFPLDQNLVIKFRDITEDVNRHRLADVKEAILAGMSVHGAIGYVRLSVRGTIDRVDQPFCDMLDLPEERLMAVPLCDLVATGDKPRFRDLQERVLRGDGPDRAIVRFLSNRGDLVEMVLSMVQLHGAYGSEGAICLMTTLPPGEQEHVAAA
ncbi:PAS domain-containing protein [Novosphingobium sp. PC22D]|uniref:PAS domain-containing protein n=1 Tax=Novosphingobium sp. PC22D TaxID=1962403 RepID=UPI001F0A105B|nr:PAS domain-containing protein [Novosphingobium sp. PC22D]